MPRLALEPPVSLVAESPRAETSMQVSPAAEGPETVSQVRFGSVGAFLFFQSVSVFFIFKQFGCSLTDVCIAGAGAGGCWPNMSSYEKQGRIV